MLLIALGTVMAAVAPAAAAGAGAASILAPDESTPLHSGGSRTQFSVVLPGNARCPGDTAHDAYHVFSYVVPAGFDPANIHYRGEFPVQYYRMFTVDGFFGPANTAPTTGQIVNIPNDFVWQRFTPAILFPQGGDTSTWQIGVDCATVSGATTTYWGTEVRFTRTTSDPGGYVWTAVHPAASPGSGTPWAVLVPIGLAVVLGLAAFGASRRGRRQPA